VRSRAGGWDIVKFVDHHRYQIVILENVVDWLEWGDFRRWWRTMENLGYVGQKVFFNSMFAPPTPQSRDRLYIVWHRKGNKAPNTDLWALAFCGACDRDINARQVFKPGGSPKARYGRQYFYACPDCRAVVHPYYFAALNAIDFTIPTVPIGEREAHGMRPLQPRTMDRIQYGIDRYGSQPLVVTVNQTNRLGGRVHPASGALFTQPGCAVGGVVAPFVMHMQGSHRVSGLDQELSTQVASCPQDALLSPFLTSVNDFDDRNVPVDAPRPTQTTQTKFGMTIPPGIMINAGSNAFQPRSVGEEMPTLTGSDRCAFALSPAFLASLRGTGADQLPYTTAPIGSPLGTISAGGIHAAIINLRDWRNARQLCSDASAPLPTQAAGPTTALLSASPFVVSYYGNNIAAGLDDPLGTMTSLARHGIAVPSIEDWCFRMFQPSEIGIGMAFPPSYTVLGTSREKVKQYGNAVTPPVMRWLIAICLESLYPETPAYDPWAEWRAA